MIGYIDGDGNIQRLHKRTDHALRIKVHKSWLKFLRLFRNILASELNLSIPNPKINNAGYALFGCGNNKVLKFLKLKTKELKLPCLGRKWNQINENFINRLELEEINLPLVLKLRRNKLSYKEISNITNLSQSTICNYVNKSH